MAIGTWRGLEPCRSKLRRYVFVIRHLSFANDQRRTTNRRIVARQLACRHLPSLALRSGPDRGKQVHCHNPREASPKLSQLGLPRNRMLFTR